jgi:acetyltransferase-like isoleucine patch superfamily enzyme
MNRIKDLIYKIKFFSEKYMNHYHLWKIQKDSRIVLGNNVSISKSSVIEIRNGGRITIGDNTQIFDGVLILSYGGNIIIGKGCSINPYTIIYGHGNTVIGDNVLIAGQSMIIPNNHIFSDRRMPICFQGNIAKGIIIEDDVWIANGCSILDGIKISRGTVVAAGSVVNKDTEEYSVVAGVPAKKIKSR